MKLDVVPRVPSNAQVIIHIVTWLLMHSIIIWRHKFKVHLACMVSQLIIDCVFCGYPACCALEESNSGCHFWPCCVIMARLPVDDGGAEGTWMTVCSEWVIGRKSVRECCHWVFLSLQILHIFHTVDPKWNFDYLSTVCLSVMVTDMALCGHIDVPSAYGTVINCHRLCSSVNAYIPWPKCWKCLSWCDTIIVCQRTILMV